jgi:Zn-dependent peptidase ImmA (M78 family)
MANRYLEQLNTSPLVRTFISRTVGSEGGPIEALISRLESIAPTPRSRVSQRDIFDLFAKRNIKDCVYVRDVPYEACLEPLGSSFDEGFRIALNRSRSYERQRFSLLHELCHTFFYEVVPELRFKPSGTDDAEEYLCNFGASNLLVPADDLKRRSHNKGTCFTTLHELCAYYEVSQQVLLYRLKAVGRWKDVALSSWRLSDDGRFLMSGILGRSRDMSWTWHDLGNTLWQAWETGLASGRTVVICTAKQGLTGSDPVYFEVVKRGETLYALWSRNPLRRASGAATLLDLSRKPIKSSISRKLSSRRIGSI